MSLSEIQLIIEAHSDEIIKAWQKHFGKHLKYNAFLDMAFCKREGIFFELSGLSLF